MTMSEKKQALKAFRKKQKAHNEADRAKYLASLPPVPEPIVKTTARERAIERNSRLS